MNVRTIVPERAAATLAQWRYPRAIGLLEQRNAYWVTDVPQTGILWFLEGPLEPRDYCVHIALAPEHRGKRDHTEVFTLIRWVAGLLGAKRVYAPLGSTHPGWARYLVRYGGFTDGQSALGPFFDLPELEG